MIKKQTSKKIKKLRKNNELEFCLGEFDEFYKNKEIVRHRTVKHTPQQNGVVEYMNRTLLGRASCMISNGGLRRKF